MVLIHSMSMSTVKDSFLICEHEALCYRQRVLTGTSSHDAIFMYDVAENGTAELLSKNCSPDVGDGPRNAYPSPDGKLLYVVTEHISESATKWIYRQPFSASRP